MGTGNYTGSSFRGGGLGVTGPQGFAIHFLSRTSILTRDIDIANLSVCPSVCLSVRYVPVPYENGLKYRHSFSPYGSSIILFLSASNIFTKFRRGHPLRGRWIQLWDLLRTEDVHLHMPALRIGTHFLLTLETVVFFSSFKHHLKTFLFSFY